MILGRFKVSGHSMEPNFHEGDQVLSVGFLGFKAGDVIVFKHKSKNFIKRIIRIERNEVFLEGDNKNDSLKIPKVQKRDIIGKVIFRF